MKSTPDTLQALIDRFDRDRFDMPAGRARVRLRVTGEGAWDLEPQRHRHRLREAKNGNEPDAEITADAAKPFPASYDAAFFSKWVLATLDALEIDRAHVLGHSMGGRVALEVGMQAPDRTDRLVAMTPSMAWLSQRP